MASLWGAITAGSGTSFAAPHITGIAAKLWSVNPEKTAGFIRCLLQASCKSLGDATEYGYGLADYAYAMQIYDEVEEQYEQEDMVCVSRQMGESICENEGEIKEYHMPEYIRANRGGGLHQNAVNSWGNVGLSAEELHVVAISAKVSDGDTLKKYDVLHARKKTNYVYAVQYLMDIAVAVYHNKDITIPSVIDWCEYQGKATLDDEKGDNHIKLMNAVNHAKDNNYYKEGGFLNKKNRALQVLGLALHVAQDTYAHRAQVTEDLIPYLEPSYFKDFNYVCQCIRNGWLAMSDLNQSDFADLFFKDAVHREYADNHNYFVDRYYIAIPWITSTIMTRFCAGYGFEPRVFHPDSSTGYSRRTQYLVDHVCGIYGTLPTDAGMTANSWRALSFVGYYK